MPIVLSDVLLVVAFILVLVTALGRAPIWPAVLLLVLAVAALKWGH